MAKEEEIESRIEVFEVDPAEVEDHEAKEGWPIPIGIICVAFGVLGLVSAAFQVLGGVFFKFFSQLMPSLTPPPPATPAPAGGGSGAPAPPPMPDIGSFFDASAEWGVWMITYGVVSAVFAVGLCLLGLFLLYRKKISRPIALVWATAKLVWVIPVAYFQYRMNVDIGRAQKEMMEEMSEHAAQTGGTPIPSFAMTGSSEVAAMANAAFTSLWIAALPVFLLIWFLLPKVKAQVAAWKR